MTGSFAQHRLPRGRHGLDPALVAESQRWRLLAATAELFAERGMSGLTGSAIASRASVSKSAFYRHFDNVEECLAAAGAMVADRVEGLVSEACSEVEEGPPQVRAGLDAALAFFAEEPELANLLGSQVVAASPSLAATRGRLSTQVASKVEPRRVDAAVLFVSDRVVAGEAGRLPDLAPELAEMLCAGSELAADALAASPATRAG